MLRTAASRAREAGARDRPRRRRQAPAANREKAEGSGETNDRNAQQQVSGKGRPGGEKGPGRSKSGAPRGKSVPSESGKSGKQGAPKNQDAEKDKSQNGRAENPTDRGKDAEAKSAERDTADSKPRDDGKDQGNEQQRDAASRTPRLPSLPLQSPPWLRTLFIAVALVALVYGLFRYGMTVLQALRDLLASLFGGLFVARPDKRPKDAAATSIEPAPPPRPFASFVNPFANGLARKFSPNELVLYGYEALEAWASEHNLARSLNETPSEFVNRLGQARADLREGAIPVVGFFVAIVYGQQGLQAEVLPALRQLWNLIERLP